MKRLASLLGPFLLATFAITAPLTGYARVPTTTDEARELAGLRSDYTSVPTAVWACSGTPTATDEARAEAGAQHIASSVLEPWSTMAKLPAPAPTTTDEARALAAVATDARDAWTADRNAPRDALAASDGTRSSVDRRCASWM